MGIYKNGKKKEFLFNYFIDENKMVLRGIIKNDEFTNSIIIPLKFQNYDFSKMDNCIELLCDDFISYNDSNLKINKIIRTLFKDTRTFLNENGEIINLDSVKWLNSEEDEEDDKDEILRVLIKTLKKNNMEICSNNGEYFLVKEKKIYYYDKDKMKLIISNIQEVKECKHLYGNRIINFSKNVFYDDLKTNNFSSLIPCNDDDDVEDTETENKISALKKLCGILKNMNENNTPKRDTNVKASVTSEDNDSNLSSFIKKMSKKTKKENFKTKSRKQVSEYESESDSDSIDINALRNKIKNLNSNKKNSNKKKRKVNKTKFTSETESDKNFDSDSDNDSDSDSESRKVNQAEGERDEQPSQMQQLLLYFMSNPEALPKIIDNIHTTIDNFTDSLNPTNLFNRKRPCNIQKYFSNVNLVLKYIEMLKIIELKYKQTLEFKCSSDDFDLDVEAKYFNDHLNKIWDMVKLILCELSALKL